VIAITSVRLRAYASPSALAKTPATPRPRSRTAVIAITALPKAPANHPVSGLPLSDGSSFPPPATRGRHLPPGTNASTFAYWASPSRLRRAGRDVIAITSVRLRTCVSPSALAKTPTTPRLRSRTAVIAITALPKAPANHPVSGLPLSEGSSFPPPATRVTPLTFAPLHRP